ncbi:MAG: hypothetical protein ABSE40_08395 [Candidatus Sulfotelmatobacter sp.]|jgi:hypothetical protein
MKRSINRVVLLAALLFLAGSVFAKDAPKYKTAEVKQATIADGVQLPDNINPPQLLNLLSDEIREQLSKKDVAEQVIADGGAVPDAVVPDSIVVECKIADFKKAGHTMMHPAEITMEINIYHRGDHTLIASATPNAKLVPAMYRNEEHLAHAVGGWVAGETHKVLK